MRTITIASGLMLVCTAGAIAAAQTNQTAAPQTAATAAGPAPEPSATPITGEPAGKSISEQGVKGSAPDRPKPRPTPKPGVKFGQE